MKRKPTLLLAALVVGGLALGVGGVRYLGVESVTAQKKSKDTHQHDHHGHTDKPKAAPRAGHKEQGQSKEHAHEAHEHKEHGHEEQRHEKHGHDEPGHAHEHAEKVVHVSEAKRKELGIELATAQPGSLKTQLSLSGAITLNTDRSVHVVSRIPGIVREVRKTLGDTVRAGDVMAVIDSRELADTKGAYLAAMERVTLTADTFQREKDLWEKKISPAEDYLKAKHAHAEARIELRSAQAKAPCARIF